MRYLTKNVLFPLLLSLASFCFLTGMMGCTQVTRLTQWMTPQVPNRVHTNDTLIAQLRANPAKKHQLHLTISVLTQQGALISNGEQVVSFPVSTGIIGHSTPYGHFSIYNKERENKSSLYGSIYDANGHLVNKAADSRKNRIPTGGRFEGASMPYTMHFSGYCALHQGFVPYPPRKASHGCIRLTPDVAALLFELCPIGTSVDVTY
ncbi:MAG: L,D-transpeptidase family protein [Akkermansia sp.]